MSWLARRLLGASALTEWLQPRRRRLRQQLRRLLRQQLPAAPPGRLPQLRLLPQRGGRWRWLLFLLRKCREQLVKPLLLAWLLARFSPVALWH